MTIGQRLREERERLGFTQPELAELADTTKKSQIDYEKDITQPRAGYLAAIAAVGADVAYIVTGVRTTVGIGVTNQQIALLENFRNSGSLQEFLSKTVELAANLEKRNG
ncbi:MAG: hypothetical protein BWK73_39545 [Thiothrix lacustris]|uniref:HTH cro/C1-type domain-containing protein n=1 Tax=Thiothrix lacustris TaxID=525917 RepID=A0A1Y1QE85_9GAMM|nr:MAG: hypothetical protein BWK73_39545 [Thiothrix lacustris]